jgi:hypothetical protein
LRHHYRVDRKLLVVLTTIVTQGCTYPEIAPATDPHQPTSEATHRPVCSAHAEAGNFQRYSKPKLSGFERLTGALSTPLKHLSTRFDSTGAWRDTGCDASGVGTPVYPTLHSTDGIYTIDVAIREAWVNGIQVAPGSCVRLEVLPGRAAHAAMRMRRPQTTDVIAFSGPLIWDKDKKPGFAFGHMEIHPVDSIRYVGTQSTPIVCGPPKQPPPSPLHPTGK